ncbi:MAG: sugar ABC transporter permease [Clostridia bacterium]|nr:sugar ABC transporter permease [Clostridia bacterium]
MNKTIRHKRHIRENTTHFERKRTITGAAFLLPSAILIALFVIWPLFSVIQLSFFEWNGISPTKTFVGFNNFRTLTDLPGFWEMAGGTVVYAVGVTAFTIIIAFLVALSLDKRGKGRINRGLMRVMWFLPCLLSMAVVGILWRIMYNYNNGVINSVLKSIGLMPVNWLETYGVTRWAIIVASVWALTGMCVVIFLAGLQSIPTELHEAASIDGASYGQWLWHITLPMMAPSITINVLTTTITAFKMYELPLIVSNGLPGYHTRLLTQKIYDLGFESQDFGRGSALSVVLILVITLISLVQLFYLRKREDIY